MENNKNNLVYGIMALGAVLAILLIIIQYKNKKIIDLNDEIDKNKKNDLLEFDYLLLWKYVTENMNSVNPSLKEQIEIFAKRIENENIKISTDLKNIIILAEKGFEKEAMFKLSKIIENLLEEKILKSEKYKNWKEKKSEKENKKKIGDSFENYILFANENQIITKNEYHTLNIIKSLRNKEAHEVLPEIRKEELQFAFMSGINISIKLYDYSIN